MSREGLRKALLSVGAVFPPHLLPLHFLLHVCYERAHAHALKSHLGSWAQLNPCADVWSETAGVVEAGLVRQCLLDVDGGRPRATAVVDSTFQKPSSLRMPMSQPPPCGVGFTMVKK